MLLESSQYILGVLSGLIVGVSLGLFGGGGSILAVPLTVYLVGINVPQIAIGTSALAVTVNAAFGLRAHARHGTIIWPCALIFACAGMIGAALGSTAGKQVDGEKLLFLFAMVMIAAGIMMLRKCDVGRSSVPECDGSNARSILITGATVGTLSGFFGIGGGFLIVPSLVATTGMPMLNAIGSSLVAVTAFGVTTSASYAVSGLINWPLAAALIGGGIIGSGLGAIAAKKLSTRKRALNIMFAIAVICVAGYMLQRSFRSLVS